ncbi:MAG: hypothetical protein FWE63_00340 [Bacteroidales bacterium]|nr:hypothetical protein [Bacteroidales bacterium]
MKAVFIAFNQALTEAIDTILSRHSIRGYTKWVDVQGRGSHDGDPHLGTHTWPAMNSSILAIIDEKKVEPLLTTLKKLDKKAKLQGLRAFVWNVEGII